MANEIDDGGPAFPTSHSPDGVYGGMTLRDYFAAAVLQGLSTVEDKRVFPKGREVTIENVNKWRSDVRDSEACRCYEMADAMLRARKP